MTKELPRRGELLVKVYSEFPDSEYLYLICTPKGVSKGFLLSWDEVKARIFEDEEAEAKESVIH